MPRRARASGPRRRRAPRAIASGRLPRRPRASRRVRGRRNASRPNEAASPRRSGSARAGARIRSTSRANAGSPHGPASRGWSRSDAQDHEGIQRQRPCVAPAPMPRAVAARREEILGRRDATDRRVRAAGSPDRRRRDPGRRATIGMTSRWRPHINGRFSPRQRRPSSRGTMTAAPAAPDPRRVECPRSSRGSPPICGWRHRHARLRRPAGGRVRLHQRVPRHRERDRHLGRDAGALARAGPSSWRPRSTSSARSPGRPWPRPSASGLVDDATTTQAIVAAALIGAITWNLITWQQGLPSSSSHALIGGLLGATIIARRDRRAEHQRHRQQGADPDVHLAAPRLRHRLRLHGRAVLDLPMVEAQADGAPLPPAAGRLGGVHGLRPRLERRPEDDGHHHPRPVLAPASSRRVTVPTWVIVVSATALSLGTAVGGWRIMQDDGPARRQARAGPRLRGRDDRGLDPARHGPLRDAGVDDPGHLGRDHGRRLEPGRAGRPLGRRPAHPHRLGPDPPGGRASWPPSPGWR